MELGIKKYAPDLEAIVIKEIGKVLPIKFALQTVWIKSIFRS